MRGRKNPPMFAHLRSAPQAVEIHKQQHKDTDIDINIIYVLLVV